MGTFSSPFAVFEYHGFSGDGPVDLYIEENLLQHRPPRPRARAGPRAFRPKITSLFDAARKNSHAAQLRKTDPTPKDLDGLIDAMETTSTKATVRTITVEPTATTQRTRSTNTDSTAAQATRQVITGTTKWPIAMMAKPVEASPRVSTNVATQKLTTTETLAAFTTIKTQSTKMATTTVEVTDQMQTTPAHAVASPSTVRPSLTTGGSTARTTTHIAPTSAPVNPTDVTFTRAATTTQAAKPTFSSGPTASPTTRRPNALPPRTAQPSTSVTTSSTTSTQRVKQKYKISWDEEEGHTEVDEPMQRNEESSPKNTGK